VDLPEIPFLLMTLSSGDALATNSGASRPLVVVLGPTGSGKTELALSVADVFDGELVGCDSLQIYRYLDIGTARTPPAERRGIPHHMMDLVDPDRIYTAGDYAREARAVLADISLRGKLPVVAGGTGFYLRALLEGLFAGPRRDEALRERLAAVEKARAGFLHRLLRRLDKPTAARIHAHDLPKLIRAIEVCLLRRRPMSEQFAEGRNRLSGYRVLKIGLVPPRAELCRRLDRRLADMFARGLIGEVRGILAHGFPRDVKPLESLGYKEALAVIEGRMQIAEALAAAQLATRQYAKRQMTWFRREKDAVWLEGFGDDPPVRSTAFDLVRSFVT
jgi:tRNA dimethylallyltransferase